ncbi:hypothetical protein PINS_up007402 [Pythium insidiosum]|nr:hypothetical protein PINS_up007402 [Pythium insidiosum]
MLPYPPTGALTWEIILLVLYYVVSSTRLFQGQCQNDRWCYCYCCCCSVHVAQYQLAASKGNRTKQVPALVLSIVLAVPLMICNVFFVQLQTYAYVFWPTSSCEGVCYFGFSHAALLLCPACDSTRS